MQLSNLPSITKRRKRRLGQGPGSGRGKTAGRGTKGQKARGSVPLIFEGGALPLMKRLPFRRGKEKNKSFKKRPVIINVSALNLLPANATVDTAVLIKHNIVLENDVKLYGVKILGDGTLSVPLTITLPVSKGAKAKIEKAGGLVQEAAPVSRKSTA
ncbi:MAG: 50S ribosomal protein L15 [Candidatus Levybacteria bacterium]|nr:50S ribosomal protein L15 [Candidatus Levybacteria bacterium]